MRKKKPIDVFVADFETNNRKTKADVWLWGLCKLDCSDFTFNTNIETFIKTIEKIKIIYFHNLAFDGAFIIDYLLRNDFKYNDNKLSDNEFNIIKTSTNQIYTIKIRFKKNKIVTIKDSLKKIPFSLDTISKNWDMDYKKGIIDYELVREKTHQLTKEEIEYLKSDLFILATALKSSLDFSEKLTIGSDALSKFEEICLKNLNKEKILPTLQLDVDKYLRKSYKGGYTYLKKGCENKIINGGYVYDVNSLYPYIMYTKPMPIGTPIFYDGRYKNDELYPIYIQRIFIKFRLKKGFVPIIQIKNNLRFISTEYLENCIDGVELTVTNIDLELIKEHYHIDFIEYIDGYKFKTALNLFKNYINYFYKIKNTEKGAKKTIAKLYLNSLYGKFATNPIFKSKFPILEDDKVKYLTSDIKEKKGYYLPIGIFITSYAREKTIKAIQNNFENFIYCDTDSLHLTKEAKGVEVHPEDLGKWKKEYSFTKGKFIRAKSYIEEVDNKLIVKCAGMPTNLHAQVNFNNFKKGSKFYPKLQIKTVPGGVVLNKIDFTIN